MAADGGRLTAIQERMLAAGQIAADDNLEILQLVLDLPPGVDPQRLHAAWRDVCDRHELLRLGLPSERRVEPVALRISQAHHAVESDAIMPVDPEHAPHRLTWAPRPDGSGLWAWTLHHAVADTHSIAVVATEALSRYAAPGGAQATATSYFDAVAALPSPDPVATAEFWRRALVSHTPLALPVSGRGKRVSHAWRRPARGSSIPDGLVRSSTHVLATAALLAAELTGEQNVVIGNVYGVRFALPDHLRDAAGPLISVLPLSVPIESGATVAEFLAQVREIDLNARRFTTASPPDNAPGNWVVSVNYQPSDWRGRIEKSGRAAFGGAVRDVQLLRRSALPLVLDVDDAGELHCRLDTWSGLYSADRLAEIAGRAGELMAGLEGPGDRLLGELGASSVVGGPRLDVVPVPAHDLVREVALRTPDAPALSVDGQELSYAELDARAARLAGLLRERGVGQGDRVGLCLPRCAELFVAVLAVLKAGGTYVPLDPDYPKRRLEFVVADTSAVLVLTTSALSGLFPGMSTMELDVPAGPAVAPTVAEVLPDDIAYVIHTSGSTGVPKGVEVTHRSVVNLAAAQGAAFGVTSDDRVLQFASLSFDASVSELFVTWAAGACLVVAPFDGRLGERLQATLDSGGITMATLPPTVLADLDPAANLGLRTLITAGEPCPRWLVDTWGRDRRLINAYGPTEATVCATTADLLPGDEVVIGHPIGNVQVFLLDEHRNPVPVGRDGEIYLGGAGVAKGYLNRPELTAERFLSDPFSEGRMYRTGDLARMRVDGALVFLGRADEQIKLRGFRIELGEVESTLAEHPEVNGAVAVIAQDKLVAYVVGVVPNGLREWLTNRLPAHLVPAAFLPLAAIPLSPSGKVDRAVLADSFTLSRPGPDTAYLAPRTPLEERLAAVWAEVLGVKQVGVHDDFFDLGGSSLQASRIMARSRAEGAALSPLTAGTVAAQAASVIADPPAAKGIPVRRRRN